MSTGAKRQKEPNGYAYNLSPLDVKSGNLSWKHGQHGLYMYKSFYIFVLEFVGDQSSKFNYLVNLEYQNKNTII